MSYEQRLLDAYHVARPGSERAAIRNVAAEADARIATLEAERDGLAKALEEIKSWSRAYPLAVFPEPDFKKAAEALSAVGITLDAISASNMRHVVEGVGAIARAALAESKP